MSMTLQSQDERQAHAKRALAQFKIMIDSIYRPLLQAVTKNRRLKVEPTATVTATDGKTVYLMVPWVLGETREHDLPLCNKRDEHTLHMLCPACDVKDQIAFSVFHESAHITSESFVPVDMDKVRPMVKDILPFLDVDPDALPAHHKGLAVQAMFVMHKIEPVYLPQIFNIVEDIYVNRRLYSHRAGVETSMKRGTMDVFTGGFTQGHGNVVKWDERPVSAQAGMVAYLLGARLPHLIDHLSDEVQVVRDDEVIQREMEDIPGDCPVEARIEIAFRVFARLRELGFCIPPSKREPEPEPEPKEPEGEPDPDMPQDPPPPPSGGGDEEGPEGQPGDDSKPEGDGESDDEDDAQSEGSGGEPKESDEESDEKGDDAGEGESDEDAKDDEADDGETGLGTEGDEDEARDGDFDEEGDDNLNKEGDAKDDEGDQDLPGGSGDDAEESGDPMEEDDGSSGQGPTPEELDQKEAEEMAKTLGELMGHELPEDPVTEPEEGFKPHPDANDPDAEDDLSKAIKWQKFDAPPKGVSDFFEETGDGAHWEGKWGGGDINFDPGTVSGETARLRAVFAFNRKTRMTGSLKSGPRLDVPNLHRIGQDDYRIFGKKDRPGKRDWFVLVGLDDSGSTHGTAEFFIREMGLAVGEMLQGCGVKFAMYGHGGVSDPKAAYGLGPDDGGWKVRHLIVKGPDEPWSPEVKSRLKALCRDDTCNYDGHTMEQYRKVIEKRRETDKMILYLTDGKMPMMNFAEELEVLERELQILRMKRVELFGVGYRTDSPKRHGIDTIVVQDSRDLPALVDGLRQRLEK